MFTDRQTDGRTMDERVSHKLDWSLTIRAKNWYPWKGLVTRNVHVKYESPTSSAYEAMAKVKVFEK